MTNLWILSDLHQDHGVFDLPVPEGADIAIVAGDVCNDQFLIDLAKKIPVAFVAGNHEFYGHAHDQRLASLGDLPIAFLDDDTVTLNLCGRKPVRVIGSTLWTDYNGGSVAAMNEARHGLNDHKRIKWRKEPWMRFRPEEAFGLHMASRDFLRHQSRFDGATVVMTHHAPSMRSVAKKYEGDMLNHAYASRMDDLVEDSGAALWVHGHTHTSFDYNIGGTRVLCNPHGYPGENRDWNPALVVSV